MISGAIPDARSPASRKLELWYVIQRLAKPPTPTLVDEKSRRFEKRRRGIERAEYLLASKQERRDAELARRVLSADRWHLPDGSALPFLDLVTALESEQEHLDVRDLMFLQTKCAAIRDVVVVPPGVTNVLYRMIEARGCQAVLDPATAYGLHTEWLAEHLVDTKIEARGDSRLRGTLPPRASPVNFRFRHAGSRARGRGATRYGAIVTVFPAPADPRSPFRLIGEYAADVADNGFFVIVAPPLFPYEKRSDFAGDSLETTGFALSAVLTFPPGAFEHSSLAFEMLIFERGRPGQLYVAEIPDDPVEQRELAGRFSQRKTGASARAGALVDNASFINLQALASAQHYARLGVESRLATTGFEVAILSATGVIWSHLENRAFGNPGRTVLVPVNDSEEALWVGSPDFMLPEAGPADQRSDRYLVLETSDDVVLAQFLTLWFNSPLGSALRRAALLQGPSIGMSIRLLRQLPLYIPSLADQQIMIAATGRLERITRDVSEAKAQFWRLPLEAARVRDDVVDINHSDRQLAWIDTMPYPLAAILQSYRTLDGTPSHKAERLVQFFHAFALFSASVHLSAFRHNADRWSLARGRLVKQWRVGHRILSKPHLGDWVRITGTLAAEVRETGTDSREILDLFACQRSVLVRALSSARIAPLLNQMVAIRNEIAHGGSRTARDDAGHLEALEKGLRELQGIIGRCFSEYPLVIAGTADVAESHLDMDFSAAVGSNPYFPLIRARLSTRATTGSLSMHELGNDRTLLLIPFVRIEPGEPLTYFFNGVREDGMLRWVCFQLRRDSQHASEMFTPPDTSVLSLIDELVGKRVNPT